MVNESHTDWDTYLPGVVFAYNTSKQSSTRYTPFEIMYARKAVLPIEMQYIEADDEAEQGKRCIPNSDIMITLMFDVFTESKKQS